MNMARVSIFLIAVALITGMVGFPDGLGLARPFQHGFDIHKVVGAEVTTIAQPSENVTTYDGDLIIDGYEEFVIEDCTWIQKGDIVIKGYGKLTVNNAVIRIEMDYWHQGDIYVDDHGSLEVVNGQITTNQPNFHLLVLGYARLRITSSEVVKGIIAGGANSHLDVTDSSVEEFRVADQSEATVFNSHISQLNPWFVDSHSAGEIDGLVPGLIAYWNLHEDEMVTNVGFDLTLTNVTVDNWALALNYESRITVSESAIAEIPLLFRDVSAHIQGIKPGFQEDLNLGSLLFRTTSVNSCYTDIHNNSVITIEDCTIGLVLHDDSECTVLNSKILWVNLWDFVGKISFSETHITDWTGIWNSRFSITGSVKFEHNEISAWVSCDVVRNYEVVVSDHDGDFVSDANLTLRSKDGTQIWHGTTDSQGYASFNLTFTDGNYTDTLTLEAVKGDLFDVQDITFLSDTPVVSTVLAQYNLAISSTAGGSVTNPGEGDFTYEEGAWFYLVAKAEEGYQFANWTGDVGTIADVNAASTRITMNDNYSITANFQEEEPPAPPQTGCFIATAAYGTLLAEQVQILREFRDEYLLTNSLGQGLVDVYYTISPPIADFITEHPNLKPIVRAGLMPVMAMCSIVLDIVPQLTSNEA